MAERNLTKAVRLSQNIRENRHKLNLTQEQLAKMIGTNRKTLGKWENGTMRPNDMQKQKLEELFLSGKIESDQIQLDPERNALLFSKVNIIGLAGVFIGVIAVLAMFYGISGLSFG